MATNKHAIIRYQALDKCFRNIGKRYFMDDLIDACNQAIYEFTESGWGTLLPNSSTRTIGILPTMVEDNNLKEGDTISVLTEISGKKTHIKEIKI